MWELNVKGIFPMMTSSMRRILEDRCCCLRQPDRKGSISPISLLDLYNYAPETITRSQVVSFPSPE